MDNEDEEAEAVRVLEPEAECLVASWRASQFAAGVSASVKITSSKARLSGPQGTWQGSPGKQHV